MTGLPSSRGLDIPIARPPIVHPVRTGITGGKSIPDRRLSEIITSYAFNIKYLINSTRILEQGAFLPLAGGGNRLTGGQQGRSILLDIRIQAPTIRRDSGAEMAVLTMALAQKLPLRKANGSAEGTYV
jgi:hypothetical protein